MICFIRKCFGALLLLLYSLSTLATQNYFFEGGRESGMANSFLTLGGIWSVYHNPAGIARTNQMSLGFSYSNHYLINELSTQSFAGIVPAGKGAFGAYYSYSGTSRYNEQKLALGYAHTLGSKIDAGIMIDLSSTYLPDEYETAHAIAGEISLLLYPAEQFRIGLLASNISGSKYNSYTEEKLNTFFQGGVSWHGDNFLIGAKALLQMQNNPVISVGTELSIVNNLDLRAGVSTEDNMSITFGLGYKQKNWRSDIAFARHPNLGFSTFLSIEVFIGREKK